MNRIVWVVCLLLASFARADGPAARPTTVTGTIGKHDDASVAATIGHSGCLLIRSDARWKELQDRLDATMPIDADVPKFDFARQSVVILYADARRQADAFSLKAFDLSAHPPQLDFFLRWDNGPELQRTPRYTKFILAGIPAAPTTIITLASQPMNADRSRIVNEFSTALGREGADIVDGLQATITPKAATIEPGDDIQIDFALHLADPGKAKPEQFGCAPNRVFVWDGKYSNGYRNHAFFVTTPEGKTLLLRPAEIKQWLKNAPHPVEITTKEPYHLPNWVEGDTRKSLKALGLDTAAPGTYTIAGLYEETGSTPAAKDDGSGKGMWGGSILSNTATVEVKK